MYRNCSRDSSFEKSMLLIAYLFLIICEIVGYSKVFVIRQNLDKIRNAVSLLSVQASLG